MKPKPPQLPTELAAGFRLRAVGAGSRPDWVLSCLTCAALVTYDSGEADRHTAWHDRLEMTLP